MRFLNRYDEMRRLDAALSRPATFVVLWGWRQVGKALHLGLKRCLILTLATVGPAEGVSAGEWIDLTGKSAHAAGGCPVLALWRRQLGSPKGSSQKQEARP